MPTSWYQAIPEIIGQIEAEGPESVLDVGIGFGKYGMLLREVFDLPEGRYHKSQWKLRIEGIEAFPGYRNPIHDHVYDKVHYGDVLGVLDGLPKYDVTLLIDVLEHFSKDDGYTVIRKLLEHTRKALIVSTPVRPAAQADYLGNPFERHQSLWSLVDLADFDVSYRRVPMGGNGAHIFKIYPPRPMTETLPIDRMAEGPVERDRPTRRPLRLAFVLPHKSLTGGMKVLESQMREMRRRGHIVHAVWRGAAGDAVLPDWFDLALDGEVLVPEGQPYSRHLSDYDVLIAGWVSQLPELTDCQAPLFYLEQGHEALFGDIPGTGGVPKTREFLQRCYATPCSIGAVSPHLARILRARYGRTAVILPDGVDTELFRPAGEEAGTAKTPERDAASPARPASEAAAASDSDLPTVILVGNPVLAFKGFEIALWTLQRAWQAGRRFRVEWVCQNLPGVSGQAFPVEMVVNPSPAELAARYRRASLHLFTSWYEGFGLPPLEAMASGTPVVATQCGGLDAYAKPGQNLLAADPGDIDSLAAAVVYLLGDEGARRILAARGRQTALENSIERSVDRLEEHLLRLAEWRG